MNVVALQLIGTGAALVAGPFLFMAMRWRRERKNWVDLCNVLRSELERFDSAMGLPTNALAFLKDQFGKAPEEIDRYEFAYQMGLGFQAQGGELMDKAHEQMKKAVDRIDRLIASGDRLWDENITLHSTLTSARAWASAARAFLIDGKIEERHLEMLDITLRARDEDDEDNVRFLGVTLYECVSYEPDGTIHDVEIAFGENRAKEWLADREGEKNGTKPIDESDAGFRRTDRHYGIEPATVVPWTMRRVAEEDGDSE